MFFKELLFRVLTALILFHVLVHKLVISIIFVIFLLFFPIEVSIVTNLYLFVRTVLAYQKLLIESSLVFLLFLFILILKFFDLLHLQDRHFLGLRAVLSHFDIL